MDLGIAAVGVPGVNGFKPEWVRIFDCAEEIVIAFDGDEAGRQGAVKLIGLFHAAKRENVKILCLPKHLNDVNDFLISK